MPSAFIRSRLGYPAMHLVIQLVHQRSVHPGPLVLRTAPLKYLTPTPDRDRTVSRRSEPSSRTALMGEQPNPWNLLQLLPSAFALFEWFPSILREPLSASDTLSEATAPVKLPTRHCPPPGSLAQVRNPILQGWYPNIDSMKTGVLTSKSPTYPVHTASNPSIKLE